MEKKITIIIPHYNSITKLERLLKTIPQWQEIQVLVIDDKSILTQKPNRLKVKYTNVTFLENKSDKKGAGVSRNIGLEYSKGEWIIFADADDYFLENSFDIFKNSIDKEVDIIFFKATSIFEETKKIANRHLAVNKLIENFSNDPNEIRYKFYVPWSKMLKKSLIEDHKIRFDEVIASNDCFFSVKSGHYAKKIKVDYRQVYCVTRSIGTLTMNFSEEVFNSRFNVWIKVNKFLEEMLKEEYQKPMLEYVIKSYRYGSKKMLTVLREVLRSDNKIFPNNFFKPTIFVQKIAQGMNEMKDKKNYGNENLNFKRRN